MQHSLRGLPLKEGCGEHRTPWNLPGEPHIMHRGINNSTVQCSMKNWCQRLDNYIAKNDEYNPKMCPQNLLLKFLLLSITYNQRSLFQIPIALHPWKPLQIRACPLNVWTKTNIRKKLWHTTKQRLWSLKQYAWICVSNFRILEYWTKTPNIENCWLEGPTFFTKTSTK